MKTMKETFSPNYNHLFFLPPKLLRFLFFVIIFGQQKNFSISTSTNTTISKISQFSSKEDVVLQPLKDISKDVSLRKSLPGCGGIFTVQRGDSSFRIFSPHYPLPYPALLDCIYDIRFERGLYPCYVELRFENFYLASIPPDCFGDRLEVGGKRFCGGYSGAEIIETKWAPDGRRHLLLRLVTDPFGTERGFSICVSPIPCIGLPPHPPPPPYLPHPPHTRPPLYPPHKPYPIPPLYPPPVPSPPPPPIPFCCGTQYQGRNIYITSPGFPFGLLSGIDCGYVINRLSPRVTHLRIKFKYFFLPCPWASLSEVGVYYPQSSKGYLSVNGRHFCGCQTGLSLLIPFGRFERKLLRLYSPFFYSQSRSSDRKDSSLSNLNNTSSSFPDVRKTSSNFKPSPTDVFLSDVSENSQYISKIDQTNPYSAVRFNRSFSIIFPSSNVQLAQDLGGSGSNSQNDNLREFQIFRQTNTTSFPLPRSDKSFTSSPYNRFSVAPALGFLLEISQVEIPYFPGKRKGKGVIDGEESDLLDARSDNISLPDVQSVSSRSFNLPTQGCGIDDLPWIRWWLWILRKKNLLQECPAVSRPPWRPPYYQPSNCGPFIPTSGVQNLPTYQNEPYPQNSKCCSP